MRLSDVNEPQQIEAPAHVRAGAPGGAFGAFAEGLVGGVSGGSVSLKAMASPNPGKAARAVRDHKKVVILFRNPVASTTAPWPPSCGAWISAPRRSCSPTTSPVERYGKLVEDLGVSQTPSIVIIDRSGHARLLEGFTDADTLTCGRGRAMSEEPGGSALRAVVAPTDLRTPPPRRPSRAHPAASHGHVAVDPGRDRRARLRGAERVDAAIARATETGRTPEQVLLEDEVVSSDELARATAQRFGLCHVDLTSFKIDLAALNLLSSQAARRLNAAPIGFDDHGRLRSRSRIRRT